MNHETAGPAAALPWEDQASHSPWPAYRETLRLLLGSPAEFYGRMARRGGLHEPMTFFLATLAVTLALSFLAALAYAGVAAPAAGTGRDYFLLTLAPKATGVALGLLPELLLGCAGLLVVGGSLFHLGIRLFGSRQREGSVSILFYAVSAALVPLAAALLVVFVVSAAGWILQGLQEAPLPTVRTVALWTWRLLLGLAGLGAVAIFLGHCVTGCAHVAELDGITATGAAALGLVLMLAVPAGSVVAYLLGGPARGVLFLIVGATLALAIALWQGAIARKDRYSDPGGHPHG